MEKNNTPKMIPTQGDCYEASLVNAEDLTKIKIIIETIDDGNKALQYSQFELKPIYNTLSLQNDIKIVHGFVIPKEGPDKGRRLHHAWIEVGKFIIETQGGMRQKRSKKEYYNTFSVEVERVYSVEEARSLVDTHKIYGAWNQIK